MEVTVGVRVQEDVNVEVEDRLRRASGGKGFAL